MGGIGRVYLDTNFFILAFETFDDLAKKASLLLSQAKMLGAQRFVTTELTLAELLVVPHRNGDDALVRFYDDMISESHWLDLRPVTRDVLISAARLRAANPARKLPDAVHVATAIACGCTHFLSSDKRIGSGPTEILPYILAEPDDATLTSFLASMSR